MVALGTPRDARDGPQLARIRSATVPPTGARYRGIQSGTDVLPVPRPHEDGIRPANSRGMRLLGFKLYLHSGEAHQSKRPAARRCSKALTLV